MDPRTNFFYFLRAFERYRRRDINNKSSVDLVAYFFEPLMDIWEGIWTTSPVWISSSISRISVWFWRLRYACALPKFKISFYTKDCIKSRIWLIRKAQLPLKRTLRFSNEYGIVSKYPQGLLASNFGEFAEREMPFSICWPVLTASSEQKQLRASW